MNKTTLTVFSIGCGVPILLLIWLYFIPRPEVAPAWAEGLSSVNAALNTVCSVFLVLGYGFIRKGLKKQHVVCMVAALSSSFLFLISYLTYHHFHGDTKYLGEGWLRGFYFFVLISHILLSVVNFPMILVTLSLAIQKNFESHRRWAKWTLPTWLYVSVTGVVIYVLLRYDQAAQTL